MNDSYFDDPLMPLSVPRQSLVAKTCDTLREAILSGSMGACLRPERQLSEEMGISRPVLRSAMRILESEGLLALEGRGQSSRRVILQQGKGRRSSRRLVVRLLRSNLSIFRNDTLMAQEYLSERFAGVGVEFYCESSQKCFAENSEKSLEHFVRSRPANVWILCRTTRAIQSWFQQRRLRCVIWGTCFEGIDYPFVDENYSASCQHAAGLFLAKGHRNLALLMPSVLRPGDLASKDGFEQGYAHRHDVVCHTAMHDGGTESICKAVDSLLSRASRPTAWLIFTPQVYLTVATYLARKGVVIGKEVSLISRDSDPYLGTLVPSVAHYARKFDPMCRRLFSITQQALEGAAPARRRWLFTSDFHEGDSLTALSSR